MFILHQFCWTILKHLKENEINHKKINTIALKEIKIYMLRIFNWFKTTFLKCISLHFKIETWRRIYYWQTILHYWHKRWLRRMWEKASVFFFLFLLQKTCRSDLPFLCFIPFILIFSPTVWAETLNEPLVSSLTLTTNYFLCLGPTDASVVTAAHLSKYD